MKLAHNRQRPLRPALALVFTLFAFLLGCSEESKQPGDNNLQHLVLANGTEPMDLDPHTVTGTPERNIIQALFEGLLARDTETLELIPAVASDWKHNPADNRYRFTLRDDARWSNGEPVTAQDFLYSWQRLLHPALANEYADSYYAIANAEAYNNGNIDDFSKVGVKAIDKKTLEFNLSNNDPLFLESLTTMNTYPVHRNTVEAHGEIGERGSPWTRPENIVSNGPYVLQDWKPHEKISLRPNTNYWDAEAVKLEQLSFLPIDDANTEERMFRTGKVHVTLGGYLGAEKVRSYRDKRPDSIRTSPLWASYFYILNTKIKPLDDVRVRRALALTINRELIVENVTGTGQIVAANLTPALLEGYAVDSGIRYDPEQARALLAAAGFPGGQGFPELTVLYNTVEHHKKIALAIQQMWARELGIAVTLRNEEWKVYLDSRKQGRYDIARAGSVGTSLDPGDFLQSYTGSSGLNDTGWKNSSYDTLVEQARETLSREQRFALYSQAETILSTEIPIIPIYYYTKSKLISPSVSGWNENAIDYISYKNIELAP